MGDVRHKKPPPEDVEEDVTDDFRKEVREALDLNARQNRLRRLRSGMSGYLISNRAELARAIGTDTTMVNKIIGPARAGSKVDLVDRSTFVGRIRNALQLAAVENITVRADRANVLRYLALLPDDAFRILEEEYKRELRKSQH